MSIRKLIQTVFAVFLSVWANAQQKYEEETLLTEWERSMKGEIIADIQFDTPNGIAKYHVKAPLFLDYNLNDLRFFAANPQKYITKAYQLNLVMKGYFVDLENTVHDAGMMYAEEFVKGEDGGVTTEKRAKGYCNNGMAVRFEVLDFEKSVKENRKDLKYTIFITCEGTRTEQKNVTGYVRFGDTTITDGVELEVDLPEGAVDIEGLTEEIARDREKMEAFNNKKLISLPSVDLNRLNGFLINPQGEFVFDFSGTLIEKCIGSKSYYSGAIRLDGDSVRKFFVSSK